MNTNYSTTPAGVGKAPSSAPNNLKYVFDPAKSVLFDVEVYPPGRWCCGFLSYDGKHACVDGDRVQLTAILDKIHRAGRTLVGYNSRDYDIPILRAVLAGADVFQVSHALINYEGWGLPPELRDRAAHWPRIPADHIDLAARTRMNGRIPALKTIAANLGAKHLQELPYPPDQELTEAEWAEVRKYNRKDLEATRLPLDHFAPELQAIAALSQRYGMDLRSVHQAGIASQILCSAYRDRHGQDPSRVEPPARVRYQPPSEVRRPQNPVAAAWYDRITTESFPMILAKGASHPRTVLPEPSAPIVVGGVTLNVGSGGLHSVDRPALHRSTSEYMVLETDVASYYPSMMASFGIVPRSLGDCGADLFAEILAERIKIKEQAAAESDPIESKRLKTMADGLKIVLNSVFGQMGNPYSVLYDPTSFLAVTLSGQLLLIDLLERLVGAGAEILSVNTDGLFFRVRRDSDAWRGALSDWQTDTGMVLETTEAQALVIEATNHYAIMQADGRVKRRGNLSDVVSWRNVPNATIVADAVVAALLHGVLPECTVRRCTDITKFVSITRRDSSKVGVLVNDATGTETSLPRLTRWYKARDSQYRIEHRWTDAEGKAHKTTPPGATSIQLLMDLPDGPLGDIDIGWYVGEARARILSNPDFPHLDPKWITPPQAQDLHARGLAPSPHWAGKHSPKGSRKDQPSYFYDWSRYRTYGTYTGPEVGVLVLDIDQPDKYHKWTVQSPLLGSRGLEECLVSYHRKDSAEAVRSGAVKGKLIFKFKADADHPLARIGKSALRQSLGIEVFYGGDPTLLGEHPDGPAQDYLLEGVLGPPPDWLIADLVERAAKKARAPKEPKAPSGNGNGATSNASSESLLAKYAQAALESEVAKVAAAEEGERNITVWKASCAIGGLVGAGVVDREEAEEQLLRSTTLPPEEAVDVVRRGLDRGAETPRDLGHIGRNGDGVERPQIEITTEEHSVNDQAIAALAADPDLYQRGHMLVRVLREGPRPDDMDTGRDPGGLTIVPIHAATLRERLTQYACWVKKTKRPDGEEVYWPVHPPDWVVPAVLNRGSWEGVRFLEGVTETPLLRADGTVLDTPGYDPRSGLLYRPEIQFPKVPENPSREDAQSAAKVLLDLVVDFPFKGPDHRAAWLAALLTPFVRSTLSGPAPLFLFDANAAGSGKTLLCDLIALVGTGRCVGRSTIPASEEEMDKVTLAMALNGTKLILFDNTATGSPIGGAALDAALTATTRSGRQLGVSRFVTDIPFSPTFLATGNNAGLRGDTLRRVVSARLEATEDRPEERDGFMIPNLLEYVAWFKNAGFRVTLGTSARTLIGPALERVFLSPWLPCWDFSSARTACTPEAPASERAADPSATPQDSCRLDWGRHCAGIGGGSGRTEAASGSPPPTAVAGRSSFAAGC